MADTVKQRVYKLMDKVPLIAKYERGDLLLVLLYWRIYDGIQIPPRVMKEILHKATVPESITRRKRELLAAYRADAGEEDDI